MNRHSSLIKKPRNQISIKSRIRRQKERLNRMLKHYVLYLDCVPVSVFVLPLFVAPVMAA